MSADDAEVEGLHMSLRSSVYKRGLVTVSADGAEV